MIYQLVEGDSLKRMKWKFIYKQFNQNGSILADFSNYSPLYKEDQFNAEFPQYYDVMVNPNYLRSFEIVDVSGHVIDISEDEKDYIILVPLKYQNVEEEIMEYYKDICEDETDNETVRIIWIPNGQKFFSCALDVGIDDDNSIIDPVVVVLTENNGYIGEYTRVAGYTGVPFKIKVSNMEDAQSEINNVMSHYFDPEKTWFYVTSVYDAVETQVQMANDKLFFYSVLIIVLVIIIIAAVIQGMIATKLIREEIGYLFQNFALVDEESVNYNLKLALKYVKGNKMHIIENALEEVGLSGYGNKKIYQLSGGEQQRVALARIIVKPSKIILADEPTGSLDEQNRDIVLNMLRKMQQQGKTIVIVTHDNYIADKCDRVISLEYQN